MVLHSHYRPDASDRGFAESGSSGFLADSLPLRDRVALKTFGLRAAATPGRNFVDFSDAWVTCGDMDQRANRAANALRASGIRNGGRIALLLKTRLEYLDLWFGLSKLGAIQIPLNPEYKAQQISQVLGRAPIAAAVVETPFLPYFLEAPESTPSPSIFFVLGDARVHKIEAGRHLPSVAYERIVEVAAGSAPAGWEEMLGAVWTGGATQASSEADRFIGRAGSGI